MDPNANLFEQRRIIARIRQHEAAGGSVADLDALDLLSRLAELSEALDGWIRGGGFLPDSWELAQKREREAGA